MELHASVSVAVPGYGCSYLAIPAASTALQVKATAGSLKYLSIAGTGTTGTVAILDGATTIFTFGVPAAVVGFGVPLPPEGLNIANLKITTTGTGVTALVGYI